MTVAVSESVRKRLHADYGFHPGKTVTIRNGADVTRFRPDPDARRAFRDRWRIPQDAFVFGTARRMTLDKGLDIAIQAFAKLPDRRDRPTPYLALVGDGPEREALVRLAESMGVADRVRFTGFSDDPASAYPAFDVFVLPSRNEALSLALVEGMACGCLPIATRVGGSSEVIADESLGWIVPPEDPAALAVAMDQSQAIDPHIRRVMEWGVRAHVAAEFDARNQYDKIIDLIQN